VGAGIALSVGWGYISSGGVPSTESPSEYKLDITPRLNMKYQVTYKPSNNGIERKIKITSPTGRVSTYDLGAYSRDITIRIPT